MLQQLKAVGGNTQPLSSPTDQDNRVTSVLHTASKGDTTGALRAHVWLLTISAQEVTLITIRQQVSVGLSHFSTSYE